MAEELLAAEQLVVRVLDPALAHWMIKVDDYFAKPETYSRSGAWEFFTDDVAAA
jgi:hypothetical protein